MPQQSTDHIDDPALLGRRLREARLAGGLRQGDLAFAGCSIGYISRIEAGMRAPSLQVVRRLAQGLGVSERWLATGEPDVPEGAVALARLRDASIALRLEQVDEAEALYAALADDETDPIVLACVEAGLGQVAFRRGEAHGAIARIQRAFVLDPALDDAAAADTLGRAYARTGDTESAVVLFRRWLERAEADSDPALRLRFAVLLTNALIDNGSHGEAMALLARTLDDTDGGDSVALARIYWSQSRLHALRDEHDAAGFNARRAFELLETTEHTYYRAKAHLLLAFTELDAGNPHEALVLLDHGRALLGSAATPHDVAEFDLEQARALVALGQPEEAAALAMRTAKLMREEGHPADAARCYGQIAAAFDRLGDTARAIEVYELAIEFLETSATPLFSDIFAHYGDILEREGRDDEAFDAYKRGAHHSGSAARRQAEETSAR
jgi:tetratricopeptide (TPR) repeat protein